MSLDLLTDPAAVHAAMDEYDALGVDEFLKKYGYGHAKTYFVEREGRRYDSKAIAGVAVGKQNPARGALLSQEFSGGEATVSRKLRELGFDVVTQPNSASLGKWACIQPSPPTPTMTVRPQSI